MLQPLLTKLETTMADELTEKFNKEAIFQRICFLLDSGHTLKDVCKVVEKETGQNALTTRKQYQSHQKNKTKRHGLCKLSTKDELCLVSIVTVFLVIHKVVGAQELIGIVSASFKIEISKEWVVGLPKSHDDALCDHKTKLLASKRVDDTLLDYMADFMSQVETVKEVYPMYAFNTCNYDKTCVFMGNEGGILLEHARKERAQKRGIKGRTIDSLFSFVAANGSMRTSVWIFKAAPMLDVDENSLVDAKFHLEPEKRKLHKHWVKHYAYTTSNYLNQELYALIMKKFCEI